MPRLRSLWLQLESTYCTTVPAAPSGSRHRSGSSFCQRQLNFLRGVFQQRLHRCSHFPSEAASSAPEQVWKRSCKRNQVRFRCPTGGRAVQCQWLLLRGQRATMRPGVSGQRCSLAPKYVRLLLRRDIVLFRPFTLFHERGQSQQSFARLGKDVGGALGGPRSRVAGATGVVITSLL